MTLYSLRKTTTSHHRHVNNFVSPPIGNTVIVRQVAAPGRPTGDAPKLTLWLMSEQAMLPEEKSDLTPESMVKGMVKLVSLPHVCIRVNLMVDDPKYSATEIGEVISQDAALTARLLRVANSSFYGFQSKISTISRAVTVIGFRELRDLVVAVSAVRTFSNIPMDLENMAAFWRHSIFTGIVSRLLSKQCRILHSERLFVAGVLHDLGQLVIFHKVPDLANKTLKRIKLTGEETYIAERTIIGFDHAEIGAELVKSWHLPKSLEDTIRFHHTPELAVENPVDTAIVHIANIISDIAEEHENDRKRHYERIHPEAWRVTGLSENVIDSIICEAHPLLFEGLALIMPGD